MDFFIKNWEPIAGIITFVGGFVLAIIKYFFRKLEHYKQLEADNQKEIKRLEVQNLQNQKNLSQVESEIVSNALKEINKDIDGIGASLRRFKSETKEFTDTIVEARILIQKNTEKLNHLSERMVKIDSSINHINWQIQENLGTKS